MATNDNYYLVLTRDDAVVVQHWTDDLDEMYRLFVEMFTDAVNGMRLSVFADDTASFLTHEFIDDEGGTYIRTTEKGDVWAGQEGRDDMTTLSTGASVR